MSPTMAIIKSDLVGYGLYSNAPWPIYLYTANPCETIPVRYDKLAQRPYPDFADDMESMAETLKSGNAAIVFFDNDRDELDIPTIQDVSAFLPLKLVAKTADGAIYIKG